jgi:uncharacterized protein YfaQ (DUF2300 family)
MDGLEMSSDILAARELRFPAQNYASAISQEISQQLDNPERRHEPDGICSPELPDPALVEDAPQKVERQSVLVEAQGLVHGGRNDDYGHPLDDWSRTAAMVSAMLAHKLREPLTAEDALMFMVCVKLSREVNRPKRDNRTDGAGYFECLDWVVDERARRG